jgi:hypothetical protein
MSVPRKRLGGGSPGAFLILDQPSPGDATTHHGLSATDTKRQRPKNLAVHNLWYAIRQMCVLESATTITVVKRFKKSHVSQAIYAALICADSGRARTVDVE